VIISLALVLLATASGTLASYLYDDKAGFAARLCAGACTGIAILGLVAFVFASLLGLTPLAILLTLAVIALPLLALKNPNRRAFVQQDLRITYRNIRQVMSHPSRLPIGYAVFYIIVALILWRVFQRAMIEVPEGIFTGVLNNFGDLPFHISVISSFAFGNNFLPEDPTYAGVRFTYPFLTDFVSAIFVRCGADLRQSMFIENFIVALAFVGLLHSWAWEMVRDRLAAVITPILVLLNGGFGWILLWKSATESKNSLAEFLKVLPASFTIVPETTWRWGNAVSTLLIPQRGMLLGLPLAVIVFTQWWLATTDTETGRHGDAAKESEPEKGRKTRKQTSRKRGSNLRVPVSPRLRVSSVHRMIAAGVVAGLLPLVHAHSFVVVMAVGAGIALLQRRWRDWIIFFAAASVIALPQMWWSTHNSAVDASKFFEWHFGWDRSRENPVWFWLKNAGMFIPLTVAALLWRNGKPLVPRRLLIFFLPFTLCFIVPNVLKMAPWIWDNIKVLFYWWLASAPLVALLLARLWRQGKVKKAIALILFVCVILAGALDVAAIVLRSRRYEVFDAQGIKFAELIKQETEPRALLVHAPVHNHPVFLTGRRSLMGYPGHIWTHGLEFTQRESEIRRVYAGAPDATAILKRYGVNYLVVSPLERNLMNVNEQFLLKFEIAGEVGGYRLYKITQP
jgi:hypothetical protein